MNMMMDQMFDKYCIIDIWSFFGRDEGHFPKEKVSKDSSL